MEIQYIQTFEGRNIYSHRPVIKMVVDIGELYDTPTKDFRGFNEKLLEFFPGLKTHFCSKGYEGGFVERLHEGTYIGHVTEHLILELQSRLGYTVIHGKTRVIREPSLYAIVFEYKNEILGIECGKAAIDIVTAFIKDQKINISNILEYLTKIAVEAELGPSTKAIFDEAKKRGIPVRRIGNESLLQLGYGKYTRYIEAALSDAVSCINVDIAGNKHLTKQILRDHDIPVPKGGIAYSEDMAVRMANEIGYPVVLKPFNGNQGKGVTLNIINDTQIKEAYNQAQKVNKTVIVEKHIKGKDYRILVVGDKISAVSERKPPQVIGDGVHTVRQLVEMENRNPNRGEDHEKPLTKIKLDQVALHALKRNSLDEEHIPSRDEVVNLRDNGNLSTGGTARDCTDEIHPFNRLIAIKAVKAIGLDIAGVDMTIEDIKMPIHPQNGAIIEINAAPGIRMHVHPSEGQPRNVAADILEMMYPEGAPSSIPIVSITGTNGKTTTTRLISHTLAVAGKKVGMTSTSGVFIDGRCVLKGDNTGAMSAKMVLSNKEVDAAVLETARGGLVKRGLGYDLADVGVITNISDDHIGLDGINTIEDLAFTKALVIEAVKPQGYAVLNADDPMIDYLLERVRSKVILFSKNNDNPLLKKYSQSGGLTVYIEKDEIVIDGIGNKASVVNVSEIPITFGGILECNIENSLAAAAALYGLGISINLIREGLKTFQSDIASNPGRFNVFDLGDFKVMLDYSHNPPGYEAVGRFIQKLGKGRLVGIIGVPGDRMDGSAIEVGKISAKYFSKVYIKEDLDLRGRKPGEIADLLLNGCVSGGLKKENIQVINSELKALEIAILDAQPGDLIVMFYEEFESAVDLIERYKKELENDHIKENCICITNPVEESVIVRP
ncbi:MAG: cyanophycin synthetase [Clostridia bacterium]|nr:cyanophycin synthetase [Clostridia bacterium]